ncbi:Nucleolar protein 8 [Dissostichus eleginoides]|uniref:Nucleolar protein 8 n=1 Tax=Dissostichus eleginoides TaxID=100907 RepID=A0AAD9CIB7_DISEL|nr:Nucleolar protein 8 [Dissostichus eleginoides]
MQRLYVGGLSHTITQKDLKDRFGKFGQVEDVELRTRKDDEGVPYKTFSYININITDADLKKCMTVLNKSKWKGGTLQIETAKESFLHRLAEERQTAEQQRLLPPAAEDQKQKMLDSLSKAGVENFTMKAAVPGTEVPGHEDWVVSKFGRVLPVLQLKCQKGSRARTLKYDPSKYSHNIRKLDRPSADQSASDLPTPVSQLTWELQGGDDDISKKRRGEFPAYEPPKRKKSQTDAVNSLKAEGKPRLKQSVDSVALTEAPQHSQPAQMKGPPLTLSDIDSDDEIHRIVAVQSSSHDALQQEEDEDKLEVVGLDYLVTPGRARQQQKGGHGDEEENDYDSADTDELSDSDYEAMFSNVTRLEISLADLQKLAEEFQDTSETTAPSSLSVSEQETKPPKKGTTPEEILAALMEDDSSEEEHDENEEEEEVPKANQTVLTSKAAAASSSSSSSEEDEDEILPAKDAVKAAPPPAPHRAKEEEERQRKANIRRLAAVQQRQKETEENKKLIQGALANLDAPAAGAGKHIVFGSDDDDDDDEEADSDDEQQTTSEIKTPKKTLFQDSQSENEAPGHKNTTTKEKLSGTHLFGGSEEEEDADEEEDGSRFDIRPEFEGRAGHKLMELQSRFGKDERFKMDSRFLEQNEDKEEESEKKKSGTEEEEALEEERKKSLSILQSVLGSSQHTSSSSKTTSKAKTFRDVSALHYDPSREEHAAFETKTEETKKESKAARRKKREEVQKLPEVSKEIYYDVSGDLKAVFGQTKEEEEEDAVAEKEETNWDQEEEKKKEQEEAGEQVEQPTLESSLLSADRGAEKEEASGFKFSFFGDDAETGSGETAEYKIESIQAPKLSWQQDPRFHDSSSDEEEEKGQEEEEKTQSNVIAKIEETPTKTGLFFFYPEDSRLTEGPKLFCRSSQLEEQKEQWEERRTELRQEYRKKHKDARRKLKTSVKS